MVKQLPTPTATTPIPIVAKLLLLLVTRTTYRNSNMLRATAERQRCGQAKAQSTFVRWAAQSRCSAVERQLQCRAQCPII
ncbi:hypothetical protein ACLKA7_009473 [Drosophila subpalustris]